MVEGVLVIIRFIVQSLLLNKYYIGWCDQDNYLCFFLFIVFDIGLKVNRLDMYGEKYKLFKGVKYVIKVGKF